MRYSSPVLASLAVSCLFALNSCGPVVLGLAAGGGGGGGGGGGDVPAVATGATISLSDVSAAPNQETVELELSLDQRGAGIVLMQFDVVSDSNDAQTAKADPREALIPVDVDGEVIGATPGRQRVIFGTPGNTQPLADGRILKLRFDIPQQREADAATIRIENLVLADKDGNPIALDEDASQFFGVISIQ